ncbi:hypothetical protein ACLF3G_04535 [Falsiroseomonas sp. HC035]|uniref:hypothetical protein n=1 Tax=Falsiroseomonas sp. HC035 TaxID=3390999 RepID=UPI003D320AE6
MTSIPIRPILFVATLALPGCGALLSEGSSAAAGIGGASLANAVGAGAAATTGIGLGVQAATRAGVQYAQRDAQRDAQLAVAAAAGPLAPGGVAPWKVGYRVPIHPDETGQVTVARLIEAGGLRCKEIVFSVDAPARGATAASRAFYTATICQDGTTWRWATAEPATERWGALQ